MSCKVHENHPHQHGKDCGHIAIQHGNHVDYLHDGHLHHPHGEHVDECCIEVSDKNPDRCTKDELKACGCSIHCECGCADHHAAGCHDKGHQHGEGCGHPAVPHGDHIDYLVNGRLHHVHGDHCDDHGPVDLV